jgi:hypothetical protein
MWVIGVKPGDGKYYGNEGRHPREGVYLPKGSKSIHNIYAPRWAGGQAPAMITDPYRPEVGATAPNDIPFKVKSGEELPAGSGG